MSNPKLRYDNKHEILDKIICESRYRPVVLFLGSGISVSSGFPIISEVIHYLAKVIFAIQSGVYDNCIQLPIDDQTQKKVKEKYRKYPSRFLEDFGWPQLKQLDADIWAWLDQDGYNSIINQEQPNRGIFNTKEHLDLNDTNDYPDLLYLDICVNKLEKTLDKRDHLQAIVQWILRREIGNRDKGAAQATLREWLRWKEWYHSAENEKNANEPNLLFGDWEILLDILCEGKYDLVDALFKQFEDGLAPTQSHRLISFLQPKLGIPLILTTNFDSLLEQALRDEKLDFKVFDIHRNAQLPGSLLVNKQLAVLKLHGSAYGLRYGERLKMQLENDEQIDVLSYIPAKALVVVLGFSGSERRVMQMLTAIASRDDQKSTNLIWIQGPGEPGPLVEKMQEQVNESMIGCRVHHTDTFLQELYFEITGSHQASSKGYSSSLAQSYKPEIRLNLPLDISEKKKRLPVQVFLTTKPEDTDSGSWATLAGLAFTQSLDPKYKIIWIDLEKHTTIESVVSYIFNQIKLIDPRAPNQAVINLEKTQIEKTLERFMEVFERGRWIIVFDSLESFGRPQMVHHGLPTFHNDDINRRDKLLKEFIFEQKKFFTFLRSLLFLNEISDGKVDELNKKMKFYKDSYIVVTIDKPRARHLETSDNNKLLKFFNKIINEYAKKIEKVNIQTYSYITVHSISPIIGENNGEGYSQFVKKTGLKLLFPVHNFQNELRDKWGTNNSDDCARAHSVICLLELIKKPVTKFKEEAEGELKKQAQYALIGLFSIFRRPRSIPLYRGIINRWILGKDLIEIQSEDQARSAIDDLLSILAPKNDNNKDHNRNKNLEVYAQRHEGGTIWLYRETHEVAYDALTNSLHPATWDNNSKKRALIDGLIAISWHLHAARTYYVDIFLPTKDIYAFFEYIYHRVSALRTITLLQFIARSCDKKDWLNIIEMFDTIKDKWMQFYTSDHLNSKDHFSLNWFTESIGVFREIPSNNDNCSNMERELTKNFDDDQTLFINKLIELHSNSLETLYKALKRNRSLFLTNCISDIILAWSNQFLDNEIGLFDIQNINNGPFRNQEEEKIKKLSQLEITRFSNIKSLLKEYFESLKFEADISKLKYENLIKDQKEILNYEFFRNLQCKGEKEKASLYYVRLKGDKEKDNSSEDVFNLLRCLGHLYPCRAIHLIEWCFLELNNNKNSGVDFNCNKNEVKRILYSFYAKVCLSFFPYWKISFSKQSRENNALLKAAEKHAISFEDNLRLTCESNEEDARYRSAAQALRARALYLQGHFRLAHHFLDLASSNLILDRLDHRRNAAILHLNQAELFLISANSHYSEEKLTEKYDSELKKNWNYQQEIHKGDDPKVNLTTEEILLNINKFNNSLKKIKSGNFKKNIRISEIESSLKKITRAEKELSHAEVLFRSMMNQNKWIIALEFGWAQAKIERLLMEIEQLFLSRPKLDENLFLKRNGQLEQNILEGMRRIHSVLDLIPYNTDTWSEALVEIDKSKKYWESKIPNCENKNDKVIESILKTMDEIDKQTYPFLIEMERMVYGLWLQFFVVGAFYSALLNKLYKETLKGSREEDEQFINAIKGACARGNEVEQYKKRWEYWCSSVRFKALAKRVKISFNIGFSSDSEKDSFPNENMDSLRSIVISIMHKESSSEQIENLWDMRREGK